MTDIEATMRLFDCTREQAEKAIAQKTLYPHTTDIRQVIADMKKGIPPLVDLIKK